MKHFTDLTLDNVVFYKKAHLDLGYKGITVIKGQNLNVGKEASNASGKSLLVKTVPQLIFDSTPITAHNKRISKKDLFSGASSKIQLGWYDDAYPKTKWQVSKVGTKTGYTYKIAKNSQDLSIRTIGLAEKKIKTLLDISEEEFYCLYYVDSRRPNTFQYGTSTQRLEFFTSIWRLDSYDSVRGLINNQISELNADKSLRKNLTKEVEELTKEVEGGDVLEARYNKLNARFLRVKDKYSDLNMQYNQYHTYVSQKESFDRYQKLLKQLGIDGDTLTHKTLAHKLKQQSLAKRKHHEWTINEQHFKKWKTKSEALKLKLSELETLIKLESLEEELLKIVEYRKQLDDLAEPTKKPSTNYLKVLARTEKADAYTLDKLKKIKYKVTNQVKELEVGKQELENISGSGQCPTCQTKISKTTTTNIIKGIDEKLKTLAKKLVQVNRLIELRILRDKALADREEMKSWASCNTTRQVLKEALVKLKPYEDYKELLDKHKELTKDKVTRLSSVEYDETAHFRLKELSHLFVTCKDFKVQHMVSVNKADVEELGSQLNSYMKKVPVLQSKVAVLKENSKRLANKQEQLKALDASADDIEVWNMLKEAYSSKGLKLLIIQKLALVIEKNLNTYAPLIFREPLKFEISVSAGTFDVKVATKINGKPTIADIRVLSGAESRAFSLLFLISILPLVPSKRRLNFLILDEADANLDQGYLDAFTQSFLPKLSIVVPHIVVITPRKDLKIEGARTITAVKKNQVTDLVYT